MLLVNCWGGGGNSPYHIPMGGKNILYIYHEARGDNIKPNTHNLTACTIYKKITKTGTKICLPLNTKTALGKNW